MDRDRGGERKRGERSRFRDESVLQRRTVPIFSLIFPLPPYLFRSLLSPSPSVSRILRTGLSSWSPFVSRCPVARTDSLPRTLCRHGASRVVGARACVFYARLFTSRVSTRAAAFPFRETRTTSAPSLSISSSRLFSPVPWSSRLHVLDVRVPLYSSSLAPPLSFPYLSHPLLSLFCLRTLLVTDHDDDHDADDDDDDDEDDDQPTDPTYRPNRHYPPSTTTRHRHTSVHHSLSTRYRHQPRRRRHRRHRAHTYVPSLSFALGLALAFPSAHIHTSSRDRTPF